MAARAGGLGMLYTGFPPLLARGMAAVSTAQPNPLEVVSTPPTNKGVEVYIPGSWTLHDPWGRDFFSLSPQTPQLDIPTFSSLQSFQVPRLLHATHKEFADSILKDGGFIPTPYLATPGYTFKQQQAEIIQGDRVYPIKGEVLPGKYVWFSIDVDLSFEQKEACKRILMLPTDTKGQTKKEFWYKQPIKFSDYLEQHSRYGNYTFRMELATALDNYRHSMKHPDSDRLPDVYLKVGGTKRYKNTATYVIIVCAIDPFTQNDPIPQFPNLTRTEVQRQRILDPKGLLDEKGRVKCDSYGNISHGVFPEFRPQGITVGQFDSKTMQWTYHDWDQLDFAFYFPSDSEAKLHCGVFPQKIYHSYCVALKRNKIQDCEMLQATRNLEGVPPHLVDRFQ